MQTKILNLAKYALTITMGAAALAACSNNAGSSLVPSGASSGVPIITHIGRTVIVNGVPITAAHPNLIARQSSVSPDKFLPDKKKKKQPYQYIVGGNSGILEFDYPKSDASIGSISGVTAVEGECTNVLFGSGKQTFWVASSS